MAAFSSGKSLEKFLQSCNVQVRTLQGQIVTVNATYFDSDPSAVHKRGTAIVVHGAPGSHKDFKYVIPILQEKKIRVIGINFPGMGYSSYDHRLKNNSSERVQFIEQIMDTLGLNNIVFLGHSRGCADVLKLGINNKDRIRGIVLANPTGFRPHRSIRPVWVVYLAAWLWSLRWLRFFTEPILQKVYKFLGFRTTGRIAGICLQVMSHLPLGRQLQEMVHSANDSEIRVITPFSAKDPLIETEISRDFAMAFDMNKELVCDTTTDDDGIINDLQTAVNNGTRHISVCFTNEEHFLQKSRAKFLGNAVAALFN